METFLILTDSVVRGINLAHDTTPIQNPATFLHHNRKNKTDAGLFTQDLFNKVEDCARGGGADLLWSKNSSVLRYQYLNIYCPCRNAFVFCLKRDL